MIDEKQRLKHMEEAHRLKRHTPSNPWVFWDWSGCWIFVRL